jgi:small ligand-binding sensory domain FIST
MVRRAMQFASALSRDPDLRRAVDEVTAAIRRDLGDRPIDLAIVFVSPHTQGSPDEAVIRLHDALSPKTMVGCSGGGIIGARSEVEGTPALSVLAGWMPGARLHATHWEDGDLPSPDAPPSVWIERVGIAPSDVSGLVVLPEPFTFAAERLLDGLDFAYLKAPKVGGLVSGANDPERHVLVHGRRCHRSGAIVLAIGGAVVLDAMVAQGCKPFGKVGHITAASQHRLEGVDGKRTLQFLQEQLEGLDEADLELARRNPLFLGIAMDPFASEDPGPGDYLIRNVLGVDPNRGSLTIGEVLSVGRAVQFHLRDRSTSRRDLIDVLRRGRRRARTAPAGAVLFSCLGRGRHLYGEDGHDTRVFHEEIGEVPLAGFFCNGEIGPVQGATHLHGYTSSFGVFRARPAELQG